MKVLCDWLAAICAFGASWFWYRSASEFVPDPPEGALRQQIMAALFVYRQAANHAARSNRLAALLSAASALFAGAGFLFSI